VSPPPAPADLDARFGRRERVVWRDLGGETVLLELGAGRYFDLDATGSRVWALLAAPVALREIVAALEAEFEAPPGAIARDLLDLVAELEREGLVERLD
jgi:hypothetical protein